MSALESKPTAWRTLIVDDEPLACELLQALVEKHGEFAVSASVHRGDQALQMCQEGAFDLLLLDIEMPGINGVNLAAELKAMPQPPVVVFVTAFAQHAIKAFELEAIDYILKPVNKQRFNQVLDKVAAHLAQQSEWQAAQPVLNLLNLATEQATHNLTVQSADGPKQLDHEHIIWLQACNQYTQVHLADGSHHLISQNLQTLLQQLPGDRFIRIHRSAAINLSHVHSTQKRSGQSFIRLSDGADLPLARSRKSLLPLLQQQARQ